MWKPLSNWYRILNVWCWWRPRNAKNVHCNSCNFVCSTTNVSVSLQFHPVSSNHFQAYRFPSSSAAELEKCKRSPWHCQCGAIYPSTNLRGSETLTSNACKSTVPSGGLVLKTPGAHYTNMLVAHLYQTSQWKHLQCPESTRHSKVTNTLAHTHTLAKVHPEIIVLWLTPCLLCLASVCERKSRILQI